MDAQPKSELTILRDYLSAVRAVRRARTIFLFVIILSLLGHIGTYCWARWATDLRKTYAQVVEKDPLQLDDLVDDDLVDDVLDEPTDTSTTTSTATQKVATTQAGTTTTQAAKPPAKSDAQGVGRLYIKRPIVMPHGKRVLDGERAIGIILPLTRFIGMAATGMLIMTHLIGVNICLAGRMGGICHATSAFFWSVVLAALLFPWGHLVPGMSFTIPDAFFDLDQLRAGLMHLPSDPWGYVLHYGQFLGVPILAILAALASGVRFSQAYQQVRQAVEPLILMKVV